MTRTLPPSFLGLILVLGLIWPLPAADPAAPAKKDNKPDLSGFKTVEKAKTTTVKSVAPVEQGQSGYLGVHVAPNPQGKLAVADVSTGSPAEKAGLRKDDVILKVAGKDVKSADVFREVLMSHRPGEKVKLAIQRANKPQEITAELGATSRPMRPDRRERGDTPRATLGFAVGETKEGDGLPITRLLPDSPAEKAGLKVGELVLKLDGKPLADANNLRDMIGAKKPGDAVTVTLKREGKPVDIKVTLGGDAPDFRPGFDTPRGGLWQKPVYRLAVVCVEFPDVKHNAKLAGKDWENVLFSRDAADNKSDGSPHGSVADYYHAISCGALKVEGKVFDWVEVKKNRMDYAPGSGTGSKTPLLVEALDKVLARDGQEALKDFDGLFFVYAGERAGQNRGSLYWPHRSAVRHGGKNWSYFLCPEGGPRMTGVSLICHEFGLMLGLPELTARQENPGSRGAGAWCCMGNPADGQPQHFGAWCKEQLGWVKPAVIDPTVKQKLILAPVEGGTKECYKILIKLDGSEYLLLENRQKKGYDASLPAEGLLIWRVVNNKPILEEAHGVEGPSGQRLFANAVPYPSGANDSFTPYTTPSSRSQLGGGLPVYITNIRLLPDGRITLHIGYEYQ